jgi:predicted transcriptional regulator
VSENQSALRLEVTYNKIDGYLRKMLRKPQHIAFKRLIAEYQEKYPWWGDGTFLKLVADIRNILVHQKMESGYIITPSEELLNDLDAVRKRLLKPKKVIPKYRKEVMTVEQKDTLGRVLEQIEKNSYSQFPVYSGSRFRGLITENSITRWLAVHRNMPSGDDYRKTKVEAIVPFEETRETYKFVSSETAIAHVEWLFRTNRLLEAVLIEERKEKKRKLIGIVTRWDILGDTSDDEYGR